MVFNELYSAYYNAVAAVLGEAVTHPLSLDELRSMIGKYAFGESVMAITTAIKEERWQLLKADGTTPIKNRPSLPLSDLQKSWLKAVALDPRIKLFGDVAYDFPGIQPLFLSTDVIVFDKYADGDDYEDERYVANFRRILEAIRNKYPLRVETIDRQGKPFCQEVFPEYLEYSQKDDKFRLIGSSRRFGCTINLGRMISCSPLAEPWETTQRRQKLSRPRSVIFELYDRRNALERVLLHFAHFAKSAEKMEDNKYLVMVNYDKDDETEMVIRLLSFGPMLKVTAPSHFVNLIKQRLLDQKSCEQE